MFLTRQTAPSDRVVTLAEAKADMRVVSDLDDAMIDRLLWTAQETVEEMCGRPLNAQTWRLELAGLTAREPLELPRTPVRELSAIAYYDADNALQTADLGDFDLYGDRDRAFVRPVVGASWPAVYNRDDAMRVDFIVGYEADFTPEGLRAAVIMLAAHWFHRPDADAREVPTAVEALVGLHRLGWVRA